MPKARVYALAAVAFLLAASISAQTPAAKPIAAVTAKNFDHEVLKSPKSVLVVFWAEWAYPARTIVSTLTELANAVDSRIKFVKLNIDENAGVATKYGVRSIPTLVMFKRGQPVALRVGSSSKEKLKKWIEGLL